MRVVQRGLEFPSLWTLGVERDLEVVKGSKIGVRFRV